MEVQQIPISKNVRANALSHFAILDYSNLPKEVFVEHLETSSIEKIVMVVQVKHEPSWIDPLVDFLEKGELPVDKRQA